MNIVLKKAVDLFFPNTSLLYVFYEAIANSVDARATDIYININIPKFSEPDKLTISIKDNGDGFTDESFERFKNVLDAIDKYHKGIGRLVFLQYFKKVDITSIFENKCRNFSFSNTFSGENNITDIDNADNYTKLTFSGYLKSKINSYDYLRPATLSEMILTHFYPLFYQMKNENKKLKIKIELLTEEENTEKQFFSSEAELDISAIPQLKEKNKVADGYLFDKYKLLYSIEKDLLAETSIISALCSDGRTIPVEVISKKEFPKNGYKFVFLLNSDIFDGKTNSDRESLDIDETELRQAKITFSKMVASVIKEELPELEENNTKIKKQLSQTYPHLIGYFENETIGCVDRNILIEDAQAKFLKSQKEILESSSLSDEQYFKSLDVASRVLTEYILYRTKIINKLKNITVENKEADIHNALVPQKQKFENKVISELYKNNIWILDDKFMSFSKVLSDYELESIYNEIHVKGSLVYDEKQKGKEYGRPDITIIFSNSPDCTERIDVVIVELKRLGIELAKNEEVISQIKQRARRLMEFYPNKIQRIWFYGIVDFNKEFRTSLIESHYQKLFSSGEIFYNKERVMINPDTEELKDIDVYIMEYKTVLADAEKRNSVFLRILKDTIQNTLKDVKS